MKSIKLYVFSILIFLIPITNFTFGEEEDGLEWYSLEQALYKMKAGDTLKSVAERYLGGAQYEKELMKFNRIDDESSIGEGFVLLLPGTERNEAFERIETAKKAYQKALDAMAEQYAPEELKLATDSIEDAANTQKMGAYDKATALGELAKNRSNTAKKLADERAVVKQSGEITSIHGESFSKNVQDLLSKSIVVYEVSGVWNLISYFHYCLEH